MGKISELIVTDILSTYGTVVNYGYESHLMGLQDKLKNDYSQAAMSIRHTPDLVWLADNQTHLIQVKSVSKDNVYKCPKTYKINDHDEKLSAVDLSARFWPECWFVVHFVKYSEIRAFKPVDLVESQTTKISIDEMDCLSTLSSTLLDEEISERMHFINQKISNIYNSKNPKFKF